MYSIISNLYGADVALAFSVAMILLIATTIFSLIFFRHDISESLSHRLNMWTYRMQTIWQDTEPECPDWADPVKWHKSNQC